MSKRKVKHESHIELKNNDYFMVWENLEATGEEIPLTTPHGHDFTAYAKYCIWGKHRDDPIIVITSMNGHTHAYIYPCCWGYTTNCTRTFIGGYSKAIDKWVTKTNK